MAESRLYSGGKYLVPTALIFVVFGIIPVLWVAKNSLYYWSAFGLTGKQFIGIENFAKIVNTPLHINSTARTLLFVGTALLVEMPLGLGIAVLLNRAFFAERTVRSLLVLPLTIPPVAVGSVFLLLLRADIGLVPEVLGRIGITYQLGQNELHAWIGMIAMDAWHWTPLVALIFLAGLTSVPPSLIESARIDGATSWEIFRHIQLPHLRTVGLVALLIRVMDLFRVYDSVWVLTGGGPGKATTLLNIDIVRTVVSGTQYGIGSALSLFGLYIIVVISWFMVNSIHQEVLG
ncbi:MAG: carbohydrate ABC transporter permease [Halobacteriales archaeon]